MSLTGPVAFDGHLECDEFIPGAGQLDVAFPDRALLQQAAGLRIDLVELRE